MDGVIADFDKAILNLCPDIRTNKDYIDSDVKNIKVNEVCQNNPMIFHNLEVIPGSISAVRSLRSMYEIYFLSTPMWHVPDSYTGKRMWIEKHFGFMSEKRLILTNRKDLCVGDYLIDDRETNGALEFTGEFIKFGSVRFPEWGDVTNYLIDKYFFKQ